MGDIQVFLMDGIAYNVNVLSLKRKFTVMDTGKVGRTQDGRVYRDVLGTYYNYTMTVGQRNGDTAALDAFWNAISDSKRTEHVCVFPYGQKTLTQQMYITGAEQALKRMDRQKNRWDDITVSFIAMGPEVPE